MKRKYSRVVIILAIVCILTLVILYWRRHRETFCDDTNIECKQDEDVINQLRHLATSICPLLSHIEINSGNESVTINKERIYLCIRDPKTKELYPLDVLIYVMLHEMSHVISKTYSTKSHNDEFFANFDRLLDKASAKGIINGPIHVPSDYCKKRRIFGWF